MAPLHTPFEEHRIFIWGKTYPELSVKYYETVCTGGVLEDGRFIRLYPIPFRYLTEQNTFSRYQWITARIRKSSEDHRPESYKIDAESITPQNIIPPDKFGWHARSEVIFKYKYYSPPSMEVLLQEYEKKKTSMGFIRPSKIELVYLENRPVKDLETFSRKMKENQAKRKQQQLFQIDQLDDLKNLQFLKNRFKVKWFCNNLDCAGHNTSILDWEIYALARNIGEQKALETIREKLDLSSYDVGFFMGNLKAYPNRFAIGGIWYPKKSKLMYQPKLDL